MKANEHLETMWYCEECGVARASRHECDPLVRYEHCVNLRLKCEDLNAKVLVFSQDWAKATRERDKALTRCEELQSLLDVSMDGNQELWWRERQERDEARQWARKLYKDVRKWRTDAWEQEERKYSVLSQLLDTEKEIADLRAQLDEARNKTLEEADRAVFKAMRAMWRQSIGVDVTRYVRTAVCALKSAGAYPADEISTVKACGIEEV